MRAGNLEGWRIERNGVCRVRGYPLHSAMCRRNRAMREAVLLSSVRTPVGRAFKGMLRATRPDELGAVAIKGALERVPQIDAKEIDDVILGCAMPEAEQGMNVARIASLRAGLPVEVSALTINRF